MWGKKKAPVYESGSGGTNHTGNLNIAKLKYKELTSKRCLIAKNYKRDSKEYCNNKCREELWLLGLTVQKGMKRVSPLQPGRWPSWKECGSDSLLDGEVGWGAADQGWPVGSHPLWGEWAAVGWMDLQETICQGLPHTTGSHCRRNPQTTQEPEKKSPFLLYACTTSSLLY